MSPEFLKALEKTAKAIQTDRSRLVTFETADDEWCTWRCDAIRGVVVSDGAVYVLIGGRKDPIVVYKGYLKHEAGLSFSLMRVLIQGGTVRIDDVIVSVEEG